MKKIQSLINTKAIEYNTVYKDVSSIVYRHSLFLMKHLKLYLI